MQPVGVATHRLRTTGIQVLRRKREQTGLGAKSTEDLAWEAPRVCNLGNNILLGEALKTASVPARRRRDRKKKKGDRTFQD